MTARSLSLALIFAFILTCSSDFLAPCLAQENPNASATGTDIVAADCPPFTAFPQLGMTVVVSCQKTDSVAVTMPLKPDALGHPREKTIRGMYEFREYRITQADQQDYAFQNLMQLIPMAGFIAKYSDNSSTITARSGDTWMLINLRGDSYNISVVRDSHQAAHKSTTRKKYRARWHPKGGSPFMEFNSLPRTRSSRKKTSAFSSSC